MIHVQRTSGEAERLTRRIELLITEEEQAWSSTSYRQCQVALVGFCIVVEPSAIANTESPIRLTSASDLRLRLLRYNWWKLHPAASIE